MVRGGQTRGIGIPLGIFLLCMLVGVVGSLARIQIVEVGPLAARSLDWRLTRSKIQLPRGDIKDANGNVLATSVKRYDILADTEQVRGFVEYKMCPGPAGEEQLCTELNPQTQQQEPVVLGRGAYHAAKLLAPLLDVDPLVLGGVLAGEQRFPVLAKNVLPARWHAIKALNISGIDKIETYVREYPAGATAGTVVGYYRDDVLGEDGKVTETGAGLEYSQRDYLRSVPGEQAAETGAFGQVLPEGEYQVLVQAEPGRNVHTSLNSDLQFSAQSALDKAVVDFKAEWGSVVVQEIDTGRILALADSNSLDPGKPGEWDRRTMNSLAVTTPVEPGSTGKVVTLASALDQNKVTPTSVIVSPDHWTAPNGQSFSDSHPHEVKNYTATGVLAASSNTGTVQIGDMLTDTQREKYLRDFGFGEVTGIELPGETAGMLAPASQWDGRQRYTVMFGQGFSGTVVQTNAMLAAVGAGGIYRAPRLVDGYSDVNGNFTAAKRPDERRVMQENHARDLVTMLESATLEGGTGQYGAVEGYRTAGKTGTTQIIGAGGEIEGTVASFTGLLPAEKPKVAITVIVYKPTTSIWGSDVAAPVFRTIGADAMRMLQVPPSSGPVTLFPVEAGGTDEEQ